MKPQECFKKYSAKISTSVETILKDVLATETDRYEVDDTSNDYQFIGNLRKPFTILVWLASKSVLDKSGDTTAGFYSIKRKMDLDLNQLIILQNKNQKQRIHTQRLIKVQPKQIMISEF